MSSSAARRVANEGPLPAMDDDELRRLNEALDEAEAEYQRGEFVDVEVVLAELRGRSVAR